MPVQRCNSAIFCRQSFGVPTIWMLT